MKDAMCTDAAKILAGEGTFEDDEDGFGEQQPEDAGTNDVPEVRDTEGYDPQELSANSKVNSESSSEADNTCLLEDSVSRNIVSDNDTERNCELSGTRF